jgi:hypothetical protein
LLTQILMNLNPMNRSLMSRTLLTNLTRNRTYLIPMNPSLSTQILTSPILMNLNPMNRSPMSWTLMTLTRNRLNLNLARWMWMSRTLMSRTRQTRLRHSQNLPNRQTD